MRVHHAREDKERALYLRIACLVHHEQVKQLFISAIDLITCFKIIVLFAYISYDISEHSIRDFKRQAFRILKAQKKHRILIHPFFAKILMLHDIKSAEKRLAVPPYIKEALHHAHGESFAKAPRAGKKRYRIFRVDQIINQFCLVYIIASSFPEYIKKLTADFYFERHNADLRSLHVFLL